MQDFTDEGEVDGQGEEREEAEVSLHESENSEVQC